MKTLLLDSAYQPIAFIGFRNLAKKLAKEKVEVLADWDYIIHSELKYPATVKLKGYLRKRPIVPRFSRKGMFKRDLFTCQYTGISYTPAKLTIDHVIPRVLGGKSTWENCVTCSLEVNAKKGARTPEQAGMKLLKQPSAPIQAIYYEFCSIKEKHLSWQDYFSIEL